MRLKSAIWVAAYIRRCHGEDAFAAVRRRGAEDRAFVRSLGETPLPEAKVEERIGREVRFDPDVWVIEVEDRKGRHFLERVVT